MICAAVVAIVGGRIVSSPLENPAFVEVSPTGAAIQSPHIISLTGNALWVEWIEPGFGIRRARLAK